jgi:biotin carboxyl carrier protein
MVEDGQAIEAQQPLVVVEAMKMEHVVHATMSGTVRAVLAQPGDAVTAGQVLVHVDASD